MILFALRLLATPVIAVDTEQQLDFAQRVSASVMPNVLDWPAKQHVRDVLAPRSST